MTKYRLKKDTPEFKAGTVFDMIENVDVGEVLTMNSPREDAYAFEVDNIDNFDEWFEEIKESDSLFEELTHDDQRDRVAVNIWFRKNKDGSHPKKMVDFIQFMEATKAVSQDEGFMVPYKTLDKMVYGFGISRIYNTIYAEENDHRIVAGQLYFDSEENAAKSIESHPEEWKTILNYNWGKGGDNEN